MSQTDGRTGKTRNAANWDDRITNRFDMCMSSRMFGQTDNVIAHQTLPQVHTAI